MTSHLIIIDSWIVMHFVWLIMIELIPVRLVLVYMHQYEIVGNHHVHHHDDIEQCPIIYHDIVMLNMLLTMAWHGCLLYISYLWFHHF